jgi:hypothetical protein
MFFDNFNHHTLSTVISVKGKFKKMAHKPAFSLSGKDKRINGESKILNNYCWSA